MVKPSIIGLFIISLFLASCNETEVNDEPVEPFAYFDIKGFFQKEATRLIKEKPVILKEIRKNDQQGSKEISITDWNKELSLFIESDINKPAWTTSYSANIAEDSTVYNALSNELRTKKITVVKKQGKVSSILIVNEVSNELYKSQEKLLYYPDSLYMIVKDQQVRILGENHYKITGNFIQ